MYIITANEIEQKILKMEEAKTNFSQTIETWSKAVHQSSQGIVHLTDFMQRCVDHVQTCKNTIAEKNIESDKMHFEQFMNCMLTTGDVLNEEMGKYLRTIQLAEEAATEEEVSKEDLAQLVHAMEMVHFSQAIAAFYEFVLAYNQALMTLYRYLEKIEKKWGMN